MVVVGHEPAIEAALAALPGVQAVELTLTHAIVAHAVFVGWQQAVSEMKRLMNEAAR